MINMPVLPRTHYLMLGIAAAMVVVFAVVHFAVVNPRRKEVARLEEEVERMRSRVTSGGWPLDYQYLQEMAREKDKELRTLEKRRGEVFKYAGSAFEKRVLNAYERWDLFKNQVSRLDYQQEFQRINSKLEDRGVILREDILNLSEESVDPRTHELVLKLWTLETVLDKVLEYDLEPLSTTVFPPVSAGKTGTEADESDENSRPGAAITVLPVVTFYREGEEENPYLREFRIRLRLKGELEDVDNFLRNAGDRDEFIAVPRMELYKPPPGMDEVSDDDVIVDLVCSAYYIADRDGVEGGRDEEDEAGVLPMGA